MPYPHLLVKDPSDALALVIPSLPSGDLPVICKYNGSTRKLKSVECSALIINTIRKISHIAFYKSAEQFYDLNTPTDILEVLM